MFSVLGTDVGEPAGTRGRGGEALCLPAGELRLPELSPGLDVGPTTGAFPPSLASVLAAPTAAHAHPWSLSTCAYLYLLVSGLLVTHVIQRERNVFTLQTLVPFKGSIPKETCNVKAVWHREPLQHGEAPGRPVRPGWEGQLRSLGWSPHGGLGDQQVRAVTSKNCKGLGNGRGGPRLCK